MRTPPTRGAPPPTSGQPSLFHSIRRHLPAAGRLAAAGAMSLLGGCSMVLFDPKGDIGVQEKNLILIALGLMLLVVIPVIALTLYFAWRYRASNTGAKYAPTWA